MVQGHDRRLHPGYIVAATLGRAESLDLLTPDGENRSFELKDVRCVYFVREFSDDVTLLRKEFLSRPKLDGLWLRLRFRDNDVLEGIVANDLLDLLDRGVHLTPPDLHGDVSRMFVPRSALAQLTVLGVVGAQKRAPRAVAEVAKQPGLFGE